MRDSIAYLADGSSSGLRIVSISDPSMPVELGSLQTASCAYGLDVQGQVAYVADQYDGLRLVDVSDPSHPFEAGYFDTGGYVDGVAVSDSLIYAADHWNGLHIMRSLYSGIAVRETLPPGSGASPTVVARGRFFLQQSGMTNGQVSITMSDITGQKVMNLRPGVNDVSALAPGVYFLRGFRDNEVRRLLLVR